MFVMVEDEYIARIPPELLGDDYSRSVTQVTKDSLEGRLLDVQSEEIEGKNIGKCLVISIVDVDLVGEGAIVHGDGGVYQSVKFKALGFYPEMHEIIEGVVVSVQNFGAFVRFSSFDGLLHISQIMDDRIDVDLANMRFIGKDTKRDIKVGDKVRVKIVALNLSSSSIRDSKIGLTMKQMGLGKLEWLREKKKVET
ncbi:DNA-directed RNA polymerase subunit E' [uncultured archaeon]|nr:DNA-directed RNA polymerase subunit E' [uncultured archaeon]